MATYYWVGGTGTWNSSNTTNWASSSGGTGGAGVPTSADSVIIDTASGTGTITCPNGGGAVCQDFTVTASQAIALGGSNQQLSVYGNLTYPSGGSFSQTTGTFTITFAATTTGKTITTNGKTVGGITFNGIGGGWTLGSDLSSGSTITLTNGSFNTGNYNITTSAFTYTAGTSATLTLGSSTINCTAGSGSWNFTTPTNLTFNANTSSISVNGNTGTPFNGGGLTYYNVSMSFSFSNYTYNITGTNTFNNLTLTGPSLVGVNIVTLSANQTINGTLTVSSGTPATSRIWLQSSVAGTARTITAAAVSLTDTDFTDITGTGAATWSGTRLGNAAGNSGITFTTKTVYWNLGGSQNWSAVGWATSSGGTPSVNNFPLAQDTAVFDNNVSKPTITINGAYNIGTIDMSAQSNAMTISTSTGNSPAIFGNWINGSGTTLGGQSSSSFIFSGRNTQTITSAGKAFIQIISINSIGGIVQLADDFTMTTAGNALTLNRGTFNANNKNVNVVVFSSNNNNPRTLTMGSGTWTLSGLSTVWNTGTTTNLTFNANTANIVLSDTSTGSRIFTGGALAYNKLTIGGTTGISTTTITGGAGQSFTEIASTKTVSHTITFGGVVSIANWTVTGTAGNIVTVNSNSPGTQQTITYTGSGTVSMDYMSITDIAFSYTLGPSNPYLVYAGANSTNGGNNAGIAFIPSTQKAYLLTTGTSWTVPSDWNNSNNTIHMIGAGGGGANSALSGNNRAAGGGGGGGGYTVLNNQSLTPSASVPYTIGTSAANTAGGNTTFNTTNIAGGGSRGTATTTPSSSGGVGGTGTYAGGTGGAGSFGTTASQGYGGGGGGGAGGPNGIGGAGGNGFGSTTTANIAGGGGGGNGGGSAGGNASSALGGNGGNNFGGTGGATGGSGAGASGTLGGGGAGAAGNLAVGGNGGSGIDIANTIGGAGGKGGTSSSGVSNINTGLYGGGGSGAGVPTSGFTNVGGAGSQGVIFIIYTPLSSPTTNSNFFFLFT